MVITPSTPLINTKTNEYPVYLSKVRRDYPHVSFPNEPTEEQLSAFGYRVVHTTTRPVGDVVTELPPEFINDAYYQRWEARSYTPSELDAVIARKKAQLSDKVLEIREKDLAEGYVHTTSLGQTFGVQLRHEDRINLIGMRVVTESLIAAGVDELQEFRSTENVMHMLTPEEALELTNTALTKYKAIMKASWALKDLIDSATTLEDLPEIPTTLVGYLQV